MYYVGYEDGEFIERCTSVEVGKSFIKAHKEYDKTKDNKYTYCIFDEDKNILYKE